MGELVNTFSWSFSAAADFDTCRRRRYWSKYAMWNGWNRNASAIQQAAYRLSKMDTRYTLRGRAVEDAIMWVLRRQQEGRAVTAEEAYQEIARPMLNTAWQDSKKQRWRENAKRHVCLHEHYYPQFLPEAQKDWPTQLAAETRQCIENFIQKVLPRLAHVKPSQEIPVGTPQGGGTPESFDYHGVLIYAIPDYVYTEGDVWHIVDWKSGRARDSHRDQLAVYGLWAKEKHGVPPGQVRIHLEYLLGGESETHALTEEDLQMVHERIGSSVAEMSEYLVDFDRKANRPLPKDEWELASDPRSCLSCSFYELCEPELGKG